MSLSSKFYKNCNRVRIFIIFKAAKRQANIKRKATRESKRMEKIEREAEERERFRRMEEELERLKERNARLESRYDYLHPSKF